MQIVFVHVPMSTIRIESRQKFWQHFDFRYHGTHPGLEALEKSIFELSHWICWLGGVLESEGFNSMSVMDFDSTATFLKKIGEEIPNIDENYLVNVIKGYTGSVVNNLMLLELNSMPS